MGKDSRWLSRGVPLALAARFQARGSRDAGARRPPHGKGGARMVLCVDAGNTNIVLGGYLGGRLVFLSRIATQPALQADQYALQIEGVLTLERIAPCGFAAPCSVSTPSI